MEEIDELEDSKTIISAEINKLFETIDNLKQELNSINNISKRELYKINKERLDANLKLVNENERLNKILIGLVGEETKWQEDGAIKLYNVQQENELFLTKLMFALCPTNHELADDTKEAFKKIIRENINEDTYTIRKLLKDYWDYGMMPKEMS